MSVSVSNSSDKNLVVIVGPTAVGKTDVAIEIARALDCEIISADSRQVYKELQIGTCKPTEFQLAEVAHHFINSHSIQDRFTVYDFFNDSRDLLAKIYEQNNVALLVGGSGLFVDVVIHGMDDLPDVEDNLRLDLLQQLEKYGVEKLFIKLKEHDPEYAAVVDEKNPRRVIRALEVCIGTGKPFSSFLGKSKEVQGFNVCKIGLELPREELYERINNRVDTMIADGLVREAECFQNVKDLPPLQTVGYQELVDYFDRKIVLDEAIERIKRNTRRYAKRQLTWFKRDEKTAWFHPSEIELIQKHVELSVN